MIVNDAFVEKIKAFGINSYEARIWTALLSRGISTAGELSDIANVPRSRSYDVLESLERKGFVVMKVGKPIKYIAVPPKEVLERVKKNVTKDAEDHVKTLETLKDSEVLQELDIIHKSGHSTINPEEYTGSLKNRRAVIDRMTSIIKSAEKEILLATTEKYVVEKAEFLLRPLQKASQRGVKIKIAAPIKQETYEINALKEFAEVKDLDLKARFLLIDGTSLLFMLTEGVDSNDPALWVDNSLFAQALEQLFSIAWKKKHAENI